MAGWRTPVAVLGVLLAACSSDPGVAPVPPGISNGLVSHTVSGNILGPDGTNLCNTTSGVTMVARLLNANFPPGQPFLAQQTIACPANRYSFSADAGTARISLQLPTGAIVALALPERTLDEVPVGDVDVTHDIHVLNGTALGGSVTLDGNPVVGQGLAINYGFNPTFFAAGGSSQADGHWAEFFGRSQLILQNGVAFEASGCTGGLATKLTAGPPIGPFVFPTDRSAIDCTMITAPAAEFSHTLTRLVVTPLPGDIGGLSPELFYRYGSGWGVQFPVVGQAPMHFPLEASHLYVGGLMIGLAPDRVLTGTSVLGEMQCVGACRDLGLDATLGFTDQTPAGRKVLWQYSDTPSPQGVGLRIRQRSFDGVPPNDYVLFHFSIQNQGSATVTFYAGFFGDWDVDINPFDDVGLTDMNGSLMFMTSSIENTGIHVGTLLRGDAPVSGNYFFAGNEPFPSLTDQVSAMNGSLRRESDGPADLRYIHAIGPITLDRGKKADLWVAVLAGENRDQLLTNAQAADADIGNRMHQPDGTAPTQTVNTQPLGVPGQPFTKHTNSRPIPLRR
jgi:hypothetical protein